MDKRYRFRLNDLPSSAEYECRHGLDNDWPVGPFHMHPHYEFYLLISGNVQMRVEDESYDAHPMDLFAFPPGVLHRAMLLDRSVPYERAYCYITKKALAEMSDDRFPMLQILESAMNRGNFSYHADDESAARFVRLVDDFHRDAESPDPSAALMHRCLEESKNAVENLVDIGYAMKEANFRFETPFYQEKGGFHLITNSLDERVELWNKALEEAGVQVLFNTTATGLLMDGDKAVGVTAKKADGTSVTVNAKAVIIASGGYLGNRDLQEKFLKTRKLNAAAGGNSLCTGDGIMMAEDAGAVLCKTFGYCPCEYGGTNSKASRPAKQDKYDQNYAFKFGLYGNLLVDQEGKRFINEGLLCDYPMSYGSEQIILNAPWYGIVDQAYVDAMSTIGLYDYTIAKGAEPVEGKWFIGNYFKGRILDKLPEDIEEGIREGWLAKADTLEELAEKFGLTDLPATVARYNEYCDKGVDEEFGTNPWYLSKIEKGPFYAVQCEPSAWSTFGGIRTDDKLRALKADNTPMEGLYVVGTDNGSLYYSPYYDVPGFCYGLCVDSGYIAANEAVEYIK